MQCPLCDRQARGRPVGLTVEFDCSTCGEFLTADNIRTAEAFRQAGLWTYRYLFSGLARESKTRLSIDSSLRERVRSGKIKDKTVPEKVELLVRYFADQSEAIGHEFKVEPESPYPAAWCKSEQEWKALVRQTALELGYLKSDGIGIEVTLQGWQWILERPKANGNIGFIAMWFDPGLSAVKSAIEEGISAAGYRSLRIDEDQFNDGVMDRIIARIRESRFVAADLTGNRGGVYYEAGFASGLNIPVFFLSREEQLDPTNGNRIHFDVAHKYVLPWKESDLGVLSQRLKDQIEALLGHGPAP